MSETSEKISGRMREGIEQIRGVDFDERARAILSQEPLLSAQEVEVTSHQRLLEGVEGPAYYPVLDQTGNRLLFTTETPHECVEVAKSYLGLTDYRPNGLTRGLYYRGVE